MYAVKYTPACLVTGEGSYPEGFWGSMGGQGTNAGHKELAGEKHIYFNRSHILYMHMHIIFMI